MGENGLEVIRTSNDNMLNLKWKDHNLGWNNNVPITISLWGFRESNDVYPHLTYIDTLVDPGSVGLGQGRFTIDPSLYRDRNNSGLTDLTFGFIAINLTDPNELGRDVRQSPVLWSRPIPLDWYFAPQWEREFGSGDQWKNQFCDDWARNEPADLFEASLPQCPCTLQKAQLDRGRFVPDLVRNVIHIPWTNIIQCMRSGRPT